MGAMASAFQHLRHLVAAARARRAVHGPHGSFELGSAFLAVGAAAAANTLNRAQMLSASQNRSQNTLFITKSLASLLLSQPNDKKYFNIH